MNSCGTIFGVSLRQLHEIIITLLELQSHYEKLMALAPSDRQLRLLGQFYCENSVNITRLKQLYESISCQEPDVPSPSVPQITSFLSGLHQVRELEMRASIDLFHAYLVIPNMQFNDAFINIQGLITTVGAGSFLRISFLQYMITQTLCQINSEIV